MSEEKSKLEPKYISELKGLKFRIPSYQRGYRWERLQVEQILEDIAESDENSPYYLQPIVVAPAPEEINNALDENEKFDYDLIDGQQRLTTLYLILSALEKIKQPLSTEEIQQLTTQNKIDELASLMALKKPLESIDTKPDYFIRYKTRKESRYFLENISNIDKSNNLITSSPDHLYMWRAYQTILKWFYGQQNVAKIQNVAKALKSRVRIIWYKLPDSVTDWKKFTDLNIGKIPLTNSELVKALFLRSSNFSNDKEAEEYEKQTFVAQWDQIERELADIDFWGFLTTEPSSKYPTKIDLFLDLISDKVNNPTKDPFYTFNYFVKWFKENSGITGLEKWNTMFLQYQRLKDWYHDREFYHRMGYLISINFPVNTLSKIFKFANPDGKPAKATNRIKNVLDRLVSMSLKIKKEGKFSDINSFRDLKYNCSDDPDNKFDNAHQGMIKRYLALYNIMVTELSNNTLRYSFSSHNTIKGGWSLEHIHAQKSETLNKSWQWVNWIQSHVESLNRMINAYKSDDELREKMETLRDKMNSFKGTDKRDLFDEYAEEFRDIMESLPGVNGLYQDEMSNLALLGKYENSTLNNSTFDVKRHKIIDMISTNFVPLATERIFMKAISGKKNESEKYKCDTEHLFFWGEKDRNAYMDDMEVKLKRFL